MGERILVKNYLLAHAILCVIMLINEKEKNHLQEYTLFFCYQVSFIGALNDIILLIRAITPTTAWKGSNKDHRPFSICKKV